MSGLFDDQPIRRRQLHSVEAEQAVIGGLLLDNASWSTLDGRLCTDHFYGARHRLLFGAVQGLLEAGEPCDAVTLAEALEAMGTLSAAGGLAYIAALAKNTPSAANIGAYAKAVADLASRRDLMQRGAAIVELAQAADGRDGAVLHAQAESLLHDVVSRRAGEGASPIADFVRRMADRVDDAAMRGDAITGLPTGLIDFDELTAGLQPADLVIVAGRPSMGKTAFSMGIAEYVAIRAERPVLVFSLEMPGEGLSLRMASSIGRIDLNRLRRGQLDDGEWQRFADATTEIAKAPIHIDDTAAQSAAEMRSLARRMHRELADQGGLGMILVDYLQLMRPGKEKDNREREVAEFSAQLKAMAKELNIPVVALSQLNRKLETRVDKRPVLSDLRDSGSLEQDADLIVFLYRDEVYNPESPQKGVAEVIVAKQRNGPIGVVECSFDGRYTRFGNLTNGYPYVDNDEAYTFANASNQEI